MARTPLKARRGVLQIECWGFESLRSRQWQERRRAKESTNAPGCVKSLARRYEWNVSGAELESSRRLSVRATRIGRENRRPAPSKTGRVERHGENGSS